MRKIVFVSFVFIFLNCSKKHDKFDLFISNSNYILDVKKGEFKIDWYKNYKTLIHFSEEEKKDINDLIYQYDIEKINGEKYVFGKANLIMPNFNDEISLKKENLFKSKMIISTQVNLEKSKLTKSEIKIFNFKEELFRLLNKNKDFKRNIDTVKFANKQVRKLFL